MRMDVLCSHDLHALADGPVPDIATDGRADADLDHARGIDQTLLDGIEEDRAMTVFLAEGIGPGIDMGIEMDEAHRPMPFGERAQQRQRDRMIAAQGEQMLALR